MYKSGIIAAAPATETLAGPDKPGQIIEPRRDSMRRSKGPLALFARDLMTSPAVVADNIYRIWGVIPPGLSALYPPNSVYVWGTQARPGGRQR